MHLPSVPFATEICDATSGSAAYWKSIIINVLKPIVSGRTSPTSLERNILDSYIMECQSLYASLNDAIEALGHWEASGSNISVLYRSQIILQERIERCSIAVAPGPIQHLPPELISEIFYYCLPQSCRPDPSTAPLLLCRVSSQWQDVAHATHRLWNHLDFTSQWKPNLRLFIQPLPSYGHPTSPLHQWLSHTSKSEITMSFNRSDDVLLPDLVDMVLLPNVANLLRLELRLPLRIAHSPFHPFFALPPHTLQSLKYLVLTQGLPDARTTTVFQASPCLTHLLLDDLDFAANPHAPGEIPMLQPVFPWLQITHLKVSHCMELELCVSALLLCQNLEVGSFLLDLRGLDFDPGYNGNDSDLEDGEVARVHVCGNHPIPAVGEPVVLPFLKELDLIVGCGESFPLQGFRFPALKALYFHHGHTPHVSPYQEHLIASRPDTFSWKNSTMFLSSLESLSILSLTGRVGSVEEITTLFHCVRSVHFLELNLEVDHLGVFRALTVNSQDSLTAVSLPHLGHLRLLLEPDDARYFPEHAIWDMVQSRVDFPHISTLESLSIITNTFQREHLDIVEDIANNANAYIPTNFDVDLKATRVVPWKRIYGKNSIGGL